MVRFNENTQECERRLRILEDKVKQARTNPFMQSIENFRSDFEILRRNRCGAQLSQFEERHRKSANMFERKLANIANQYQIGIKELPTAPSSSHSEDIAAVRKNTERHTAVKTTIIREREIIKIRCPHCHGLYDESYDRCPHCGAAR